MRCELHPNNLVMPYISKVSRKHVGDENIELKIQLTSMDALTLSTFSSSTYY